MPNVSKEVFLADRNPSNWGLTIATDEEENETVTAINKITGTTFVGTMNDFNYYLAIPLGDNYNSENVYDLDTGALISSQGSGSSLAGDNGQAFSILQLTEELTIEAAASTDTSILMPAGALILGVSTRVTVAIPTAASFTVGDLGDAARFSTAAVSTAVRGVDRGTKAGAYYNAVTTPITITPDEAPAAATGKVRVTIYYIEITPPTS